jgi:opacity protein-like surface antigen
MPVFEAHGRTYGLLLGRAAPTTTNGFSNSASPGAGLALQHLRYPIDWIAYGGELSHESMGSAKSTALHALLRVNLLRERPWTPYLMSGVGWHSAKLATGSSKGLTVSAGFGLEFFVIQSLSVVLDARYRQYRLERGAFGGNNAESMTVTIGANIWRFN